MVSGVVPWTYQLTYYLHCNASSLGVRSAGYYQLYCCSRRSRTPEDKVAKRRRSVTPPRNGKGDDERAKSARGSADKDRSPTRRSIDK